MNVVMVHNYYGSSAPSGENEVFEAECQLLQEKGDEVWRFTRHSDDIRKKGIIGMIQGGLTTAWNPFTLQKLKKIVHSKKPLIVHVHNSFPLVSPSIFYSCNGTNTATVLTLHNYRTFCAAGIPMRRGQICTECIDRKSILPAIKYGCYRKSRIATLPIVFMVALHRKMKTWQKQVDAYIALTSFQKGILSNAGLPTEKVYVKPNFYKNAPNPKPFSEREEKVIFIGRLSVEKGIYVLLEAWKQWGNSAPLLEIVGDGPERINLEKVVHANNLSEKIILRGQLPFSETQSKLSLARLLILPSIWFEGFPMVIREAFALGVAVAASDLGSMPCIVKEDVTGTLFVPGSPNDLQGKVKSVWNTKKKLQTWGEMARREFEQKFTSEANYKILLNIYEKAIEHRMRKVEIGS